MHKKTNSEVKLPLLRREKRTFSKGQAPLRPPTPSTPRGKVQSLHEIHLINQLREEDKQEISLIKDHEQKRTGNLAVFNYYNHYKRLDRILDANKMQGQRGSSFTALLESTKRKKVLPCKLGYVKSSGKEQELKANYYLLGDSYVEMLAEGLSRQGGTQLLEFSLSGNRITNKGAAALFKIISRRTKRLDLSDNSLSFLNDGVLTIFGSKDSHLEELRLDKNRFSSKAVVTLLNCLKSNRQLQVLGLSNNQLSSDIMPDLCELLSSELPLAELYLRWNNLGTMWVKQFFTALCHSSLRVLDLSFNLLGGGPPSNIQALCQCLSQNQLLLHLDLSKNDFTLSQSESISQSLESNTTLLGFHFLGNFGKVDSEGHLRIEDDDKIARTSCLSHAQYGIRGCKAIKLRRRSRLDTHQQMEVCWICEGWSEVAFQTIASQAPLYLHCSHNKWTPRLMCQRGQSHSIKIMLPPGETTYYFSKGESEKSPLKLVQRAFPSNIVGQGWKILINSKPRSTSSCGTEEWALQSSLWGQLLPSEQQVRSCREQDLSGLQNSCEDLQLLSTVHKQYDKLVTAYCNHAVIDHDYIVLTSEGLSDLVKNIGIADCSAVLAQTYKDVRLRQAGRSYLVGLLKPAFFQAIIKLVIFYANSIVSTPSQTLTALLNSAELTNKQASWRPNRFYNQNNEIVIRKYQSVFACMKKKKSKADEFVSLSEFKSICYKIQPGCDERMVERAVVQTVGSSQLRNSAKVQHLTIHQFYQSTARLIENDEEPMWTSLQRCFSVLKQQEDRKT